jgi:DNA-binding NtrC family response regulator
MRRGDPTTGGEQPEAGLQFGDILPTVEQATQLLRYEALARSGGNISEAARLIGISHQALSRWLKDHGG